MRWVEPGALYVVATPIGNLADLGQRAAAVLTQVDLVVAEDTRRAGVLLSHIGAGVGVLSLHEHNEAERVRTCLQRVMKGESLALISDAGTPLISDPGFQLVRAAAQAGVAIYSVPGPCAAIAALAASALPPDRFVFEGFLPERAAARRRRLQQLADDPRTLICYESPRRLAACLADAALALGETRAASVGRELSKRFETHHRGSLGELARQFAAEPARGEIVLCIAGAAGSREELVQPSPREAIAALSEALPPAQAARLAVRLFGGDRARWYALAQATGQGPSGRNR